jgi:peptide/nickel transport system permease protein
VSPKPNSALRYARAATSVLGRLLGSLFALAVGTFLMVRISGNPIEVALGDRLTEDQLAERISQLGLDQPIILQFSDYLVGLARADLGSSIITNRDVGEIVASGLANTLELAIPALIIGILLAYLTALWSASKPFGAIQGLVQLGQILLIALPAYIVAMAVKIFASWPAIDLPSSGRLGVASQVEYSNLPTATGFIFLDSLRLGNWSLLADAATHALLPIFALSIVIAASLARAIHLSLVPSLAAGYSIGARAKGQTELVITSRRAMRPIASGLAGLTALEVAGALAGSVFIEHAFEWRGIGYLMVKHTLERDYPVVQGLVLAVGVIVILSSFVGELLSRAIDPRLVR